LDFEKILKNVGYEGIIIAFIYLIIPFIAHKFFIQDNEGVFFAVISSIGTLLSVVAISIFVFIYFENIYPDKLRAAFATLIPFFFGIAMYSIYTSNISLFAGIFWSLLSFAIYIFLYGFIKAYILSEDYY